ncbi:sensor histidine kinase [Streptomyces corynorhini]|uniref:histidine kinase n=1 Tax=Streptomyces corynorhini TaxID=2282652 RepID=A0A370B0L9_9ACTN|nr:HAMP domain-containing sensor histidine kinase [Streptomyces corynorhini]RDG34222.1 sensor histidine kinase [Streptomyces corynorhini]
MTPRPTRPRLPAWSATLTWKAAVFITVMCCALAALLGALVHVSVTRQTVNSAREKALSRLTSVTRTYEAGEPLPRFAGLDAPGLPEPLRALALRGRRGTMVADFDGRPTMWAAGPADGRTLVARVDYTLSQNTITNLDQAILGSSALAIGATLLVGAFAVTRVTRRLHLTARVARRIGAGDLDARVNDPRAKGPSRPQDEVATVAAALDTMASTLQDKLLSEQRFTADVAHELRTPLTGLSAAAELLPESRPTEMVRERVRTMRTLTEDLLEISRLDARTEQVDLAVHPLGPLVAGVVRASGTQCEVRIVRDVPVETDRRRLERVLGNLVANAHRHGGPPVVLTVDGPTVTVRDHGAGYPAYLLEHGPQRFRTEGGGKGHGLGLTIAVGQSAVIGAGLVFGDAPDGGALARLTLPAYVPDGTSDQGLGEPDGRSPDSPSPGGRPPGTHPP